MRLFPRRYKLFVWDHPSLSPHEYVAHEVMTRHATLLDAIASAKCPPYGTVYGWAYRIVDRWSGVSVFEWTSANPFAFISRWAVSGVTLGANPIAHKLPIPALVGTPTTNAATSIRPDRF